MILQKAFTLTQGGADTAAETTIATNIQPGITLDAWAVKAIEFTIKPDLMKAWANVDSDFTVQFTKRSLTGSIARIVTFTDTDLISSYSLAINAAGTPATLSIVPATFFLVMPADILVYSENLYAQIISTATGQTNVAWGRILYETRKLSQSEALSVVASRP